MLNSCQVFEVPFHIDERLTGSLTSLEATVIDPSPLPTGSMSARLTFLYSEIRDAIASTLRPLVISGDCMTAIATVAGLQESNPELGVIWIDAHGDFNTPETTVSGYIGGMPLATLVGRGDQTLMEFLHVTPIAERNVVLIGSRDLDPAEKLLLNSSEVRQRLLTEVSSTYFPKQPIYLHVDVDILDPAEMPGLRYPAPNGETLSELSMLLATTKSVADIAAIGLACTWDPQAGTHSRRDEICSELIALLRS